MYTIRVHQYNLWQGNAKHVMSKDFLSFVMSCHDETLFKACLVKHFPKHIMSTTFQSMLWRNIFQCMSRQSIFQSMSWMKKHFSMHDTTNIFQSISFQNFMSCHVKTYQIGQSLEHVALHPEIGQMAKTFGFVYSWNQQRLWPWHWQLLQRESHLLPCSLI